MPTLSVSYTDGQLSVTGGDDDGPDVTVQYGESATIRWMRIGTNFKFKGLTLDPPTGPFSDLSVSEGQIEIVDHDDNTTGQDQVYKYTITYRDASGKLKNYDPKVINKARISLAMPEPPDKTKAL